MSIINMNAIESVPLCQEPFDFIVVRDAIPAQLVRTLNHEYPDIDRPANYAPQDLSYGPNFGRLLAELDSDAFQAGIADKFGVDLEGAIKTITVRKFSEPSDGHIHTDHWSKIITLLVYFNPQWTQAGGRLRMLRSADDIEDYAAEVIPEGGTLLAFRRSARSWHGYKRFDGERRMLQMSWVKPGRLAWFAQQAARRGTHAFKRLARQFDQGPPA